MKTTGLTIGGRVTWGGCGGGETVAESLSAIIAKTTTEGDLRPSFQERAVWVFEGNLGGAFW